MSAEPNVAQFASKTIVQLVIIAIGSAAAFVVVTIVAALAAWGWVVFRALASL